MQYSSRMSRVAIDGFGRIGRVAPGLRNYLLVTGETLPHITKLVGQAQLHVVKENAGNYLLTNQPL